MAIAYASVWRNGRPDRGLVKIVDTATGSELTTIDLPSGPSGLTFAGLNADGTRVLVATPYASASLWDANRGELISSFGDECRPMKGATLSRDGRFVAWPCGPAPNVGFAVGVWALPSQRFVTRLGVSRRDAGWSSSLVDFQCGQFGSRSIRIRIRRSG